MKEYEELKIAIIKNQHKFSRIKPTIFKFKNKYYRITELG